MLTPQQTNAVASALLANAKPNVKEMDKCPSCGAHSISKKARNTLQPFWHVECPSCQVHLRIKWATLLLLSCAALLALLAVGAYAAIPGFRRLPAPIVIVGAGSLAGFFYAIGKVLPLEPKS